MSAPRLRAALEDIGTINDFFSIAPAPPDSEHHPLSDLWERPALLAGRIADVRERIARRTGRPVTEVEERVAASILHQGLASRVLSPAAGAALAHGVLPDPATLAWRSGPEGALRLVTAGERGLPLPAGPDRATTAARAVRDHALRAVLDPVATALRARVKLPARLLWGNAASSLAGTVADLGRARPELAADARALADLLLGEDPLSGLGGYTATAAGSAPTFRRRTCCLYYRVPGCDMCGDCALRGSTRRGRARTGGSAQR